jgi:hypothetical protein
MVAIFLGFKYPYFSVLLIFEMGEIFTQGKKKSKFPNYIFLMVLVLILRGVGQNNGSYVKYIYIYMCVCEYNMHA